MNDLNFYSIDGKRFHSIFFSIQIVNVFAIFATFLIINNGVRLFPALIIGKGFVGIALSVMVGLALIHTLYGKRKLRKIDEIEEFEKKVDEYENLYKYRMFWFLFSCLIACILGILSGRVIFFYFGIVDVIIAMPYYPTLLLFRKELKNEDIVLD